MALATGNEGGEIGGRHQPMVWYAALELAGSNRLLFSGRKNGDMGPCGLTVK